MSSPGSPGTPTFSDVIVAVHGIGQQSRFETVRSVATRLAGLKILRGKGHGQPVAPQPLGFFHSDVRTLTSVCLLDDADTLAQSELATIGFSEVFWADIPEEVVQEGRTLEETKAWARTVMARAEALCRRAAEDPSNYWIVPPDFEMAAEVLEEVIDTIYVLENLLFLAEKAGVLKFDLRKVLVDYVDDVQLVTEFGYYRTEIVGRFHQAMESIYQQCAATNPNIRLHIVAHSEGTVVSFVGLLLAMSQKRCIPSDPPLQPDSVVKDIGALPEWLHHVHGYMTIGSPIDKHLLLWPRLWRKLTPKLARGVLKPGKIQWRNYYDYGDPVGFDLDSARLWLAQVGCDAFQFCGCKNCHHDMGFARYFLPGAAHTQYWNDSAVFEHFIQDVVKPGPTRPEAPRDKWYVAAFSPLVPYAGSFLLLGLGVFVLFKAVHAFTHPNLDPLQRFVRFTELGIRPPSDLAPWPFARAVFGLTALIAGGTLLARVPRLAGSANWTERKVRQYLPRKLQTGPHASAMTKLPKIASKESWKAVGAIGFILGSLAFLISVPVEIRNELGERFSYLDRYLGRWGPTAGLLAITALAGLWGYLVTTRRFGNADRRQRWVLRGMRPLIVSGVGAVGLIVLLQLRPPSPHALGLSRTELDTLEPRQLQILQDTRLGQAELRQVIDVRGTNWMSTIEKVAPVLEIHPPAWPVLLAGAFFLYLWWLSALIFDLAFVWHRYVRQAVVNDRLREWNPYGFSRRWDPGQGEPCSNPDNKSLD